VGSAVRSVVFAGPLVAAQLAWSALRGHGIEAWLLDQNVGNLYAQGDVRVVVASEALAEASALLAELGQSPAREDSGPSQTTGKT
jgi:hypothetical protein